MTARSLLLTSVEDRPTACRSCGARIVWARTPAGRNMPLNADVPVRRLSDGSCEVSSDFVHWATCRSADQHRAGAARRPSEAID